MFYNQAFLQKQFAEQLSNRLDQFTLKSYNPYVANYRCGICGDSQKNKFKKRGYIIENQHGLRVMCHNCGLSQPIKTFLQEHYPDLYQQYVLAVLKERNEERSSTKPVENVEKKPVETADYTTRLTKLSDLAPDHPARSYMASRLLPGPMFDVVFYTDRFLAYVNTFLPGKFSEKQVQYGDHPRIVMPLCHKDGTMFGVIGRSLDPEDQVRYLTIKFDPDANKIYGLERLDPKKHAYVVEGPIDSLFLPNAVALAGTDGSVDGVFTENKDYTIVLDNQPRAKDVLFKYAKYVSQGNHIVIWPSHITSKDINQMVLDGLSAEDVLRVIDSNTYHGLSAQIQLSKWKKI